MMMTLFWFFFFFFQAEDGIRDKLVTGVQTCALPIYRPQVPVHGTSTNGNVRGTLQALVLGTEALAEGHTGYHFDQLSEVAAVERQLSHLRALYQAGQLTISGLDRDRRRLDGDLLGDGTEFQPHVEHQAIAHMEHDARLLLGLKARVGNLEPVGAEWKVGEVVCTVGARLDSARESRTCVGYSYLGACDGGVLLVRHDATNGSSDDLRAHSKRDTEQKNNNPDQRAIRVLRLLKMNLHGFTLRDTLSRNKMKRGPLPLLP